MGSFTYRSSLLKRQFKVYFLENVINLRYIFGVVGDYINIMKTTFDFNFDFKQHGYTQTWK